MSNARMNDGPRRRLGLIVGAVFVVAAAVGYGSYRLGMMRGQNIAGLVSSNAGAQMTAGEIDPATGKRVLYWHDPMVPGQRFDQPGRSPFMNMALVPVYEGGDDGAVEVSPRIQQNLGIRTADVVRGALTSQIEAVGNIAYDERDQVILQARATAYIERLHVRATLDEVSAGDPLAELYIPAWIAAQEEFLAVAGMRGADTAVLVDAARQRMRQAGMTDEQIRSVEDSGAARPGITLRAPISGVVVELAAREGMTVMPGETLFKINGLDTVWANAEVPETQAALLRPGALVEARSPAVPGTVLAGSVQAILPGVDPATRTIKARVELANTNRELAPGMFVNITVSGPTTDSLLIPTEAVIATGRRTVVMRAEPTGTFQPVEVEIGFESNGQTEVKSGLDAGDKIVVSGQFLLDSEASLRATGTRMEATPAPSVNTTMHTGDGKVEAVDSSSVTLSHGPIPSAQWGSMTMQFELPAGTPSGGLEVGQSVHFTFVLGDDGKPRIVEITPATGGGQ